MAREVYRMTVKGKVYCSDNKRTRGSGIKFFDFDQSGFPNIYSGYAEAMFCIKNIMSMYGYTSTFINTEEDLLKMLKSSASNGGYCGKGGTSVYAVKPASKATLTFNFAGTTIEAYVSVRRVSI